MYQFTGTVTKKARCLGKKLCFFEVVLKGGKRLQVKVLEDVLTDEDYKPEEMPGVKVNSKLLSSALKAALTVRVTGFPEKFNDGIIGMVPIGIKIHIPKPDK